MKLKITALLLIVCMLLVSCAANDTPSDDTSATDEPTDTVTTTTETVTTEAPVLEPIDLMKAAILKSGYKGSGLDDLAYSAVGTGFFKDYTALHSSPLKSADYVWDMKHLAEAIASDTEGVAEFCISTVKDHGFMYDIELEYTVYSDVDEALTALFEEVGDTAELSLAKEKLASVSEDVKTYLAKWLSAVTYSYKLISQEAEKVSADGIEALLEFYCCFPASDDIGLLEIMKTANSSITMKNLLKGELAILKASEELAQSLSEIKALTVDGNALSIPTPIGDIILGSAGNDTYSSPEAMLIAEPDGDDTYNGRVAAGCTFEDTPISVLIDLGGDDIYTADKNDGFTQGAGVFGAGMLFDMKGNDSYEAGRLAQGSCILGMGVLFDAEGDDSYELEVTGQGAGFYGLALLCDGAGSDSYNAKGYAQASAGPRCMAYLVDLGGDDEYFVQPYAEEGFEVLKYDQFPQVNGNWSQGCGWGQRVIDLSGGVAGLIDLSGNDSFTGGIWVQGVGYWSGVGFLFNEGGDDKYNSCYYSQASVAHYGAGILVDVGGNDVHTVSSEKVNCGDGASLGFVWDRGTAVLVNDGGDDEYTADQTSCGVAWSAYDDKGSMHQDMTYAIFIDTEGCDEYSVKETMCFGWGRGGFFIDSDGRDKFVHNQKRNNSLLYGSTLKGGVFYDYSDTYQNTPEPPYIGFWDAAKGVN